MANVTSIPSYTYVQRIALSGLANGQYVYQSDTASDGGVTYPQGYYQYSTSRGWISASGLPAPVLKPTFLDGRVMLAIQNQAASNGPYTLRGTGVRLDVFDGTQESPQWMMFADALSVPAASGGYFFEILDWPNNRVVFELDSNRNIYLIGNVAIQNALTPATLAADQNDYAPSGYISSSVWRLSASGLVNITGISSTGVGDGAIKILRNVGANAITLKNASASSLAANRFVLKADISIAANGCAHLMYDNTTPGWYCVATY